MARTLLRDPYHDETKVLVALQSYAVNRDGVPVTVTVGERRRGGKGSLVAQHPAWWIEDLSDVEQIAQAQQLQASWRERFARSCRRSAGAKPSRAGKTWTSTLVRSLDPARRSATGNTLPRISGEGAQRCRTRWTRLALSAELLINPPVPLAERIDD